MFSCKQVAELTAAGEDRPLSIIERISLWIHRSICPPCRNYQGQMRVVQTELSTVAEEEAQTGEQLDTSARQRILEEIQRRAQD
ncbi:MAG: hypothetical protein AAF387_09675 [Pseudomonadota bacterium]